MPRSRWHRLIEAVLPWYDPEAEAQRDERSHAIHEQAIEARIKAEETIRKVEAGGLGVGLREGYRQTGQRLAR